MPVSETMWCMVTRQMWLKAGLMLSSYVDNKKKLLQMEARDKGLEIS